jgi:outer membrane cobalamin receptor
MNYPLSSFSYSFGAYAHYSNGEYPYVHQLTNNRITRINANGVKFGLSSSFFFDINRVKEIAIGGDFSLYLDKKGVPGAIEFPSYYATLQDKKLSTAITYQYKNNPLFSIEIDSFFSYSYRLWDPNRTSSNPSRFSVHENSAVSCALSLQRDDEIGEFSSLLSIHSSFRYDTLHSSDLESLNSSAIGVSDSFYRIHTDIALHDTFSFKNLSIIPSFRVDTHDIRNWDQSYSSLATHLSSNVGASLRLYDNLTFKLNIGSAYRVPSFDDMFWSSSAFAVGNPYLRSEHAFSFDVSFDYKVHKLISISALYFSNSIKDLIQWIPSADGKWSPHNIGLVEKRGVNWAVKIDIPLNSIIDTSISLDYQYIDAVDMGIGGASYQKKLPFIAPHIFKGTFSIGDTSQWNAEIDISYTSYRFITAANTKIAPHNVLINTSLLFSLTTNWILTLKINNLTNQEYYDAQFYPIPGIHGNITLTYKGEHKK